MGSPWLLLLLLSKALAHKSCNPSVAVCAEGIEAAVDSRSMLARKTIQTVMEEQNEETTKIDLSEVLMQKRENEFVIGPLLGSYRLTNQRDGAKKCLTNDYGNVNVLPCHNTNDDNQQWYADLFGTMTVLKSLKDTSKCVTVESSGNEVTMSECSKSPSAKQTIHLKDGRLELPSLEWRGLKQCLDWSMRSNYDVVAYDCHTGDNQQWWMSGVKPKVNLPPPITTYHFKNQRDGAKKCLDLDESSGNVIVWECHIFDNQRWYWSGSALKNRKDTTKCVTLEGDDVKMSDCSKSLSADQKVELKKGTLYFTSRNKCLDWDGHSDKNVIAYGCHKGDNQQWRKADAKPEPFLAIYDKHPHFSRIF